LVPAGNRTAKRSNSPPELRTVSFASLRMFLPSIRTVMAPVASSTVGSCAIGPSTAFHARSNSPARPTTFSSVLPSVVGSADSRVLPSEIRATAFANGTRNCNCATRDRGRFKRRCDSAPTCASGTHNRSLTRCVVSGSLRIQTTYPLPSSATSSTCWPGPSKVGGSRNTAPSNRNGARIQPEV